MRRGLLLAVLLAIPVAVSCGDDGDDDDDGTPTGGSTGTPTATGDACATLAAMCPNCTIPNLRATCEAAVATGDQASCNDGLTDPDIQSNCQ